MWQRIEHNTNFIIILACVPALHAGKIEKLVYMWWESTVMSLVIIYVFYTALVPAISDATI